MVNKTVLLIGAAAAAVIGYLVIRGSADSGGFATGGGGGGGNGDQAPQIPFVLGSDFGSPPLGPIYNFPDVTFPEPDLSMMAAPEIPGMPDWMAQYYEGTKKASRSTRGYLMRRTQGMASIPEGTIYLPAALTGFGGESRVYAGENPTKKQLQSVASKYGISYEEVVKAQGG